MNTIIKVIAIFVDKEERVIKLNKNSTPLRASMLT